MNSTLWDTIIYSFAVAISSAVVSLIGTRTIGKKKKKIYEDQLNLIYVPTEKILHGEKSANQKLAEIQKIISDNYLIFPPAINKEVQSLRNSSATDLDKLQIMVRSYYEWTKRRIKYPFDEQAIRWRYTPITTKWITWLSRFSLIYLILTTVACYIYVTAVYENQNPLHIPENWLIVIGCFAILSVASLISAFLAGLSYKLLTLVSKPVCKLWKKFKTALSQSSRRKTSKNSKSNGPHQKCPKKDKQCDAPTITFSNQNADANKDKN